ncbi:MAG: tRNA guanosine(34) transglycosylase Tgt [Planctomycetaceae bacterium]|nr:tRNA guanosine(34) transglycosylase Tgt [Planctomycetota bacterium]NUO15217.1 tRNA guanosine(34) transglycosylase Tgt [Planctomycetaceae bacterium]
MPVVSELYQLQAADGAARAGLLQTDHGSVQTPVFMAVGTQGTVKACTPDQLAQAGITVVLGNTYHLELRPGSDTVAALGGLHAFMGWSGPILTDSGGFQVFSLGEMNRVSEEGCEFKSHLDGSSQMLTPERSMLIQHRLGSDIVMQLDDVPALPAPKAREEETMRRSLRWAARCKAALPAQSAQGRRQRLFGIVQGGLSTDLRRESALELSALDLPGYAIGGLSVGETKRQMQEILGLVTPLLPADKPRYLMGVGYPEDLIEAVGLGVDMFDCVLPTRSARHAMVFTSRGRLRLKNSRHGRDNRPIDPECDCYACVKFSRGYLRHLLVAGEFLGMTLLTLHNLAFYARLMRLMRSAIMERRFTSFAGEWLARVSGDAE